MNKSILKKSKIKKKLSKKVSRKESKKKTEEAKKKKNGKHAGGRPTDYKKEYIDQAFQLCLLGAIDTELAKFFEVSEKTLNTWKKKHPEFLQSIKDGKEKADSDVAKSLYNRAMGYTHPEEKIFQHDGEIIRAMTTKHYPPDATSMIFWLKNRQGKGWMDKVDVKHTGNVTIKYGHRKKEENNK